MESKTKISDTHTTHPGADASWLVETDASGCSFEFLLLERVRVSHFNSKGTTTSVITTSEKRDYLGGFAFI